MDRFTSAFEALLAALADAVKQLGEGSQQPWARTRVEEAKQDFVSCCDYMCFQLKQAVEMIKQEMLHHVSSSGSPPGPAMDSEHVRQVLDVAERFVSQLRAGAAGGGGAAAATMAAADSEAMMASGRLGAVATPTTAVGGGAVPAQALASVMPAGVPGAVPYSGGPGPYPGVVLPQGQMMAAPVAPTPDVVMQTVPDQTAMAATAVAAAAMQGYPHPHHLHHQQQQQQQQPQQQPMGGYGAPYM